MKKTFTLFILIAVLTGQAYPQAWKTVGKSAFSDGEAYSQQIVLLNDVPYVAYQDLANSRKATVMKYNGTAWEPVGKKGFTPGQVSSLGLAAGNNTLYVAFSDAANNNKASVMKFDGSNWVNVGPAGFTQARCDVISIDVDNGIPWVALEDVMQNSKITVMKYSGEWTTVGSAGFNTGGLTNVIHLDVESGTPFVAYRDYGAGYKASVMKFDGNNWVLSGQQGFTGGTYDSYSGLAVLNGVPYVAGWNADAKLTVYKFGGSGWSALGTDGISEGQASSQTLRFSPSGTLYAVFKDAGKSNKAVLKKFDGNNWLAVGEPLSPGNAINLSLAFSSTGEPYVAYRDEYSMRRTSVMKYGIFTGIQDVDGNKTVKIYPNPNNGIFIIELPATISGGTSVEIINLAGQSVFKACFTESPEKRIDLSGKPKGIYLAKVSQGKEVLNTKIVIR